MTEIVYSTNQVEGAILNGSEIAKVDSKLGDAHKDGARGIVVGSVDLGPLDDPDLPSYGYWVRWTDMDLPVYVQGDRITVL